MIILTNFKNLHEILGEKLTPHEHPDSAFGLAITSKELLIRKPNFSHLFEAAIR
jgi:hypothetical protein